MNATLTYDLTSGCGTAGIGRLCGVVDASGTTAYEYNDLGHLIEVNETRSSTTFTTAYTYDLAGNVLTITLPSGRVITYTRNANGQVSGVSAVVSGSSVNLASSIAYLPFGPITGMTYGNALTFTATYDQDYNPTNRTVSTIYNHTYDTDDNGNITQIGTPTFGYDSLNRLNAETPGSVSYTYDATSNRLTKVSGGTTTTTVPAASNKISAVGGNSITYSSSGAFLTNGTQSYVWNAAEQMAESKVSGSTVGTYTYDSQNRRTKKVAGGNTTQYVYGLNGLLYGEYTTAGALIREYVYLDSEPLAQVDAGTPEVLTYLHTDHLGTPRFGTNTGGTQVWVWASDAFGNGAPSGARTVNLRMPGQYFDNESDLFYNWNRYYNPAIGRYVSSDPIGIDGGLNTFLYAEATPVMYIDPEGLQGVVVPTPMGPLVLPAPITGSGTGLTPQQSEAAAETIRKGIQAGTQKSVEYCRSPLGIGDPGCFIILSTNSAINWCQQALGDESASRSIPSPPKPKSGCTCTCRADANDNIVGNIQSGDKAFAFGTATAHSCQAASKDAKKIAAHNLGKQPKHSDCRCQGK